MIRSEIGESGWLGSGCPLWASVGLVDGVRIGIDIGAEWHGHRSAQSLLRDQATRNFANQILWQIGPDCILLRERFLHLADAEVRSLALFAAMPGGVLMTSDALDELPPERVRIWRLLLNSTGSICRFPFLGQAPITHTRLPADLHSHRVRHQATTDPVLVQVRGDDHQAAIFVFNTGETLVQRTYPLKTLGLERGKYLFDWTANRPSANRVDEIAVTLAPHDGALLLASPSPILSAPEQLP